MNQAASAEGESAFQAWLWRSSPGWPWDAEHLEKVFGQLERISRGEVDRLIITMPPRHMKTETVTVRYVAHRLLQDPTERVVVAAYNQTTANRFSRKIRRLVRAESALSSERTAVEEWETLAGGGLRAAGLGSGITGMGFTLLVLDDPIKGRKEADSPTYREDLWNWFVDDLFSRKEGDWAIILIMTRWHEDDLVGRLLQSDDGPNWTVLHLPAIALDTPSPYGTIEDDREPGEALWPDRYPTEKLEQVRRFGEEGERGFQSLYQGLPSKAGGATFDLRDWDGKNRYDAGQPLILVPKGRFMLWDTAESEGEGAAYSAVCVADLVPDGAGLYKLAVREAWRAHLSFPRLMEAVYDKARFWNQDGQLAEVAIEAKSSGVQVFQQLMAEQRLSRAGIHVQAVPATQSKEVRAMGAARPCALGRVLIPQHDPIFAPWVPMFLKELGDFPTGRYKDMVDAFSHLVIRHVREIAPIIDLGSDEQRRVAS